MMASSKLFIRTYWPLVTILILAGFFRLYQLGAIPVGFHNDEVSAGYIGRYLFLHGGTDITGHKFPLFYDTFGDFRPIGIFLLSGLSTFLFGVNEFAVRFASSLFGILSVIPVFLITLRLFRNRTAALLAGFLFAVSPWSIVLSRATSEGVIGLFFLLTGIACMLYYAENKSLKTAIAGLVSFGLTYFFYHSFRVLTPLVIAPFFFYPKFIKPQRVTILAGFLILLAATVSLSLTMAGSGRLKQVIFTSSPRVSNNFTLFSQGEGPNNTVVARIFHNKPVVYIREFLNLYSDYFSPSFLFGQGGLPDRYVVPDTGLFPWVLVVLLGAGMVAIFTKRSFANTYLLWLLIISPLPAAVTIEDVPNVHRAISLMVPLIIISAAGGAALLHAFSKKRMFQKVVFPLFSLIFILETVYFWHQYSVHEQAYKSYYRNDMFREMVKKVNLMRSKYDVVYVPEYNSIPLYYLFYSNTFTIPPGTFRYGGIISGIHNIQFVDNWCPTHVQKLQKTGKKALFINKGDCPVDSGFNVLETMNQHDGARAFQFVE